MNINGIEQVGSRLALWKSSVSNVGDVCGRIHDLTKRYDEIHAALNTISDDEQARAQFLRMEKALNDSERLFRQLEIAASVAKVASRNTASLLKKFAK